jgi:hypothetical protein
MKITLNQKPKPAPEQVGRKYEYTRFGVLSRKVGDDGAWYGTLHIKTEAEAQALFKKALSGCRYEMVGGMTVDFGPDSGERYERKLVRAVMHCEVLAVGEGRL